MATRGVILGTVALLVLLVLGAGCTLRSADGAPTPGTTPAATTAPTSTGAGGAEETPIATTVETFTTVETPAIATETPAPTATPTPTATPVPDESVAAPETTVATTPSPDPVPTGTRTIAEIASADPELSRFTEALRRGGIYETLNGTGTYTVFAPDNAAFDVVTPGTLSRLLFDREALVAVADYHVVYGRWLSSELVRESSVTTRSGTPLAVTALPDGTLQVDGARVVKADIVATNGVLHAIDRVMIPPGAP